MGVCTVRGIPGSHSQVQEGVNHITVQNSHLAAGAPLPLLDSSAGAEKPSATCVMLASDGA